MGFVLTLALGLSPWKWGNHAVDGIESDLIGISADSPSQRRPMFYYVAHPCWKTLSPSNLESTFGSIFEHIGHSMDLGKFQTEPWNHGRGMILFFMALPQAGERWFFTRYLTILAQRATFLLVKSKVAKDLPISPFERPPRAGAGAVARQALLWDKRRGTEKPTDFLGWEYHGHIGIMGIRTQWEWEYYGIRAFFLSIATDISGCGTWKWGLLTPYGKWFFQRDLGGTL